MDGRIEQNEGVLGGRILYLQTCHNALQPANAVSDGRTFFHLRQIKSVHNILSLPSKACILLSQRTLGTCLHTFQSQAVEEEKDNIKSQVKKMTIKAVH